MAKSFFGLRPGHAFKAARQYKRFAGKRDSIRRADVTLLRKADASRAQLLDHLTIARFGEEINHARRQHGADAAHRVDVVHARGRDRIDGTEAIDQHRGGALADVPYAEPVHHPRDRPRLARLDAGPKPRRAFFTEPFEP